MDKKTLRQTLHEIAQAEMPQVENRRDAILEKAERMNNRTRGVLYLRTAAAVIVLALIVNVVYQTAYPTLQPTFPEEDQRVTPLNLQKTIGDVTVTLESVYFDVKTIRVRYSVTGQDEWLVRRVADTRWTDLRDTLGNQFIGGGVSHSNYDLLETMETEETLPSGETRITVEERYNTAYFRRPEFSGNTVERDYLTQYSVPPSEVALIFELNRDGVALPEPAPRPEGTQEVAPERPEIGSAEEDDVFRFEFSVPIYTARVIEPDITTIVGDVDVRLSRVELTPSVTSLYLCHDLPTYPGWVIQEPKLTLGGREAVWKSTTWRGECDRVDFEVYYDGEPTTLQLEWAYFQEGGDSVSPDELEEWEYIAPLLEERGLKLEIEQKGSGMSMRMRNLDGSKPERDDWDKLYRDILYEAGLRDRVYGPWEYTVELGES